MKLKEPVRVARRSRKSISLELGLDGAISMTMQQQQEVKQQFKSTPSSCKISTLNSSIGTTPPSSSSCPPTMWSFTMQFKSVMFYLQTTIVPNPDSIQPASIYLSRQSSHPWYPKNCSIAAITAHAPAVPCVSFLGCFCNLIIGEFCNYVGKT